MKKKPKTNGKKQEKQQQQQQEKQQQQTQTTTRTTTTTTTHKIRKKLTQTHSHNKITKQPTFPKLRTYSFRHDKNQTNQHPKGL